MFIQRYKYYSDKQNIYYKIINKLINIMNYINKFETTEEFNQAKGELSKLEHYMAYDEQKDIIYMKKENNTNNSFTVTLNGATSNTLKLRTEDGNSGEFIQLNEGENEINNADYGFICYSQNNTITSFNFSNYDTSKITNMTDMFNQCGALTSLNLSNFDTSNVTDMSGMFVDCNKLISLDLSNFDVSQVINMYNMFRGCSALTTLKLPESNSMKVTNTSNMFNNCSSLTTLNLSNFDTSNVTNMMAMFGNCRSLESLDISNFDISKVTDVSGMFSLCNSLTTLNLGNFDTSNVTNMSSMFMLSNNITKIICTQAVKDWCMTNKDEIQLPPVMVNGTVGAVDSDSNWEIVDYQG